MPAVQLETACEFVGLAASRRDCMVARTDPTQSSPETRDTV